MSEFSKHKNLFIAGTILIGVVILLLISLMVLDRLWLLPNFKILPNQNSFLTVLVISVAAYLCFLLMLHHGWRGISKSKSAINGWLVLGTLLSGAAVVGALIWLTINEKLSDFPEVQNGVLIVLAVSILAFLLFILALGFQTLGLSDVAQPLALPSGSVRAFIALMLIMIFVIVSIFAVRLVGQGIFTLLGTKSQAEVDEKYLTKDFVVQRYFPGPNDPPDLIYRVWQVRQLTDDGIRLAQQLITTVATLVVAVSGFYFGSQTVEKAKDVVAASLGNQLVGAPLIRKIDPDEGKTLDTIAVTLTGRNLFGTKYVRLVKDQETIEADNILSGDTTIQCSFTLNQPASTENWNLVVENAQGQKDELENAFTITGAPQSESTEIAPTTTERETPPPPEQTENNPPTS